jgi:hypothetical protein
MVPTVFVHDEAGMHCAWSGVCPRDALYVPSNADEALNIGITGIQCDEAQCNMDEMMSHSWTTVSSSPGQIKGVIGWHCVIIESLMMHLGGKFLFAVCRP